MKIFIYLLIIMCCGGSVSAQLIDPRPIDANEREFVKKNRIKEASITEYRIDGKKKSKTTYYDIKKYDSNGNLVYLIEGDKDKDNFIKNVSEYTYDSNQQLVMEKYTSYVSNTKIDLIAYTKYEYENGRLIQECNYDSAMNLDGYKPCDTYTYKNDTLIALDKYNDCILEYKGDSVFQKTRYGRVLQCIYVKNHLVYQDINNGFVHASEYDENGLMLKSNLFKDSKLISTDIYQYKDGLQVGTISQVGEYKSYYSTKYSFKYYK